MRGGGVGRLKNGAKEKSLKANVDQKHTWKLERKEKKKGREQRWYRVGVNGGEKKKGRKKRKN